MTSPADAKGVPALDGPVCDAPAEDRAEPAERVVAEGVWFDGVRPVPHPATLFVSGAGWRIEPLGLEPVLVEPWRAELVRRAEGGELRPVRGSDALLRLGPSEALRVAEALRRDPSRRAAVRRRMRRWSLAIAIALPILGAVAWFWPETADAMAYAVPPAFERALGEQAAQTVIGDRRICGGAEGQAVLDRLALRLGRAAGVEGVRVQVLDADRPNAVALPGGRILLFRGLVVQAASQGEIAGVLAHEIAHVRERHGLRSLARLTGPLVLVGSVIGSGLGNLLPQLLSQHYSRAFESEADRLGARFLGDAGIDGLGLLDFFQRHRRSGGAWFDSHPGSAERAEALRGLLRPGEAAFSLAEWRAIRVMC